MLRDCDRQIQMHRIAPRARRSKRRVRGRIGIWLSALAIGLVVAPSVFAQSIDEPQVEIAFVPPSSVHLIANRHPDPIGSKVSEPRGVAEGEASSVEQEIGSPQSLLPSPPVAKRMMPGSELSRIAAQHSSVSTALRFQAQSSRAIHGRAKEVKSANLYQTFVQLQADRQSQISAQDALTLYYGLAALEQAETLQLRLISEIDAFDRAIRQLQSKGATIADDSKLARARIQARDALLETQYGNFELRSKLSLLVGSDLACSIGTIYEEPERPGDPCSLIELGLLHRPDLGGWHVLLQRLNRDTLDLVTAALDNATFLPSRPPIPACKFIDLVFGKSHSQIDRELRQRRHQIQQFVESLESQIRVDIEIAWKDADLSFVRWQLAQELAQQWESRVQALEAAAEMGVSRVEDRIEGKLELRRSEIEVVRRWFDFQQSRVKLLSTIGGLPSR